MKCPKCDGELIKGFLTDETIPSVEGWQGWREVDENNRSKGGSKSEVKAFSCNNCGFIEIYRKLDKTTV